MALTPPCLFLLASFQADRITQQSAHPDGGDEEGITQQSARPDGGDEDGITQQSAYPDGVDEEGITQQSARPDGGDEESPAQAAQVNGNKRATSAGEHRAERGEDRMKIRASSWIVQLCVWVTFLGLLISNGRLRAIRKQNEGVSILDSDYKDDFGPLISTVLFGVFFALSLLWYYSMCADSGTRQFVANLNRELNVQSFVQQLRTVVPVIRFDATCYHYETRTRTVADTSTDASGRTTTTYR